MTISAPITAICFDLDGVLVDSAEWHFEALNVALREFAGTEIGRYEHETVFNGLPTRVKLAQLVEQGRIRVQDVPAIAAHKQRLTVMLIGQRCAPDLRLAGLLTRLSKTYRLACVTNCVRSTADLLLERLGLAAFFEVLVTNEDACSPKPSPEPYQLAMRRLGVQPGETLVVEDTEHGRASALAAGTWLYSVTGPAAL